jgi:hypothetical protein
LGILAFETATVHLFMPNIDLFTSRLNHQVERYVALHPDPEAEAIDAFSLDWSSNKCYAFPPFSLLGKVV